MLQRQNQQLADSAVHVLQDKEVRDGVTGGELVLDVLAPQSGAEEEDLVQMPSQKRLLPNYMK